MKINGINSINNTSNNSYFRAKHTSFGRYYHTVCDSTGKLLYMGETGLCRGDLDFVKTVKFVVNKYKDVPKVNVLAQASSDGEEICSFVSILISNFENESKKFLPAIAKDINPEHLNRGKAGIYDIYCGEYLMLNKLTGGRFIDFFERKDNAIGNISEKWETKPILKDNIIYKQGNIFDDMKENEFKNTIVFARNFWKYLQNQERKELSDIMTKKFDKSTTLIIGNEDKKVGVDKLLIDTGFVETSVKNVFEKL